MEEANQKLVNSVSIAFREYDKAIISKKIKTGMKKANLKGKSAILAKKG